MESVEALSEGGWSSFSGMFSTEETNFMAQLLGNYPLPNEPEGGLSLGTTSTFWPAHEATLNMVGSDESTYYYSDTVNPSLSCFPLGSSYSSGSSSLCFPNLGPENYYLSDSNPILVANDSSMSMDYSMVDEQNTSLSIQVYPDNLMKEVFPDNLMKEADCLNEELGSDRLQASGPTLPEAVCSEKKLQSKRESEMLEPDMATENKIDTNASENPRKKSQVSGDVQRTMKKTQSKKKQKLVHTRNDEEENNAAMNRQSSSGFCSEDDSNASEELNGGGTSSSKGSAALNLNGKTRASRGSATDSQSLYARKRRERINERLRILQNLVPNGTKVDISTMLEEAVQYVNFLQLQIKLLSSDDLWMYAPIAYNGMNLGLDLKISTPQ